MGQYDNRGKNGKKIGKSGDKGVAGKRGGKEFTSKVPGKNSGKDSVSKVPSKNRDKEFISKVSSGKNEARLYKKKINSKCPISDKCGGCQYIDASYNEQLAIKQKRLDELFKSYKKPEKIIGMENPYYYRNKVHAVLHHRRDGSIIAGVYEEGTHNVLPVEKCYIENEKARQIIDSILTLLKSFKIKAYNEDTGFGMLRHILIRTARATGQIMVVLVTADAMFPSRNNFAKALKKLHPEISTIVQNINDKSTSVILGEREQVMYGKGYINDTLCGKNFKISPKSFYQVNPVQTEILYDRAIKMANLTGNETIIDAYCGIGTIGIIASDKVKEVIGVELNKDAIKDAITNAKINKVNNISFYNNDAGRFMVGLAEDGKPIDVVFMDPPRSGSDEAFLSSVVRLAPEKVVYISCGPDTLARDLKYLTEVGGYGVEEIVGVDLFPMTEHVETVVLMTRK